MTDTNATRLTKTGTKTGKLAVMRSPKNGAECPTGAHPKNTGGKKGRSGRRSQKLATFLAELRQKPDVHQAIEEAASDPDCRSFGMALRLIAEYDNEKPAEKRQIVGPVEVHVKMVREGRRLTSS
jgi:hypothetical protein